VLGWHLQVRQDTCSHPPSLELRSWHTRHAVSLLTAACRGEHPTTTTTTTPPSHTGQTTTCTSAACPLSAAPDAAATVSATAAAHPSVCAAEGDKRAKKQRAAAAKAASGSSGATGGGTPEEPPLLIELYSDAAGVQPIPPSTLNGCAWPTAVLLRVGAQDYDVVLNPPTVEVISLPSCPLAGYPLWPSVALAFASPGDCLWRWLRRRPGASGSSGSSSGSSSSSGVSAWEDAGCSSRTYTPSPADEGWLLRVECTPRRMVAACDNSIREEAGETVFADCGPVAPSPLAPAAVVRAPPGGLAPLEAPWQARVLSYNILAEQYAGTAYAQDVLFNYCPRAQLASAYRRQLVLQELRAYCPDVAALQEVDATVFNDYLEPHLSDGMPPLAGRYSNKAGRVREGAATFWRTDKWAAVAARDIGLRVCGRIVWCVWGGECGRGLGRAKESDCVTQVVEAPGCASVCHLHFAIIYSSAAALCCCCCCCCCCCRVSLHGHWRHGTHNLSRCLMQALHLRRHCKKCPQLRSSRCCFHELHCLLLPSTTAAPAAAVVVVVTVVAAAARAHRPWVAAAPCSSSTHTSFSTHMHPTSVQCMWPPSWLRQQLHSTTGQQVPLAAAAMLALMLALDHGSSPDCCMSCGRCRPRPYCCAGT
jgi:hypothetical protein